MSSNLSLLVTLGALAIYACSVYSLNSEHIQRPFRDLLPKLRIYGQYKFLTYQCLLIQLANALLHLLAHFIKPLRGLRDLVFSALAYPVGSIVVLTFWTVWFVAGREVIFPAKLDAFFPSWLNHSTHSVILPINLVLASLIHHKYTRNGSLLTLGYFCLYIALLYVVKAKTGLFVYVYLDRMSDTLRLFYFACTALFAYLMYKSGQLLTYAIHGSYKAAHHQQRASTQKKQK